jgi:hypothetical protein
MEIEGAKGISIFSSIGGFERRCDDEGGIILPVANLPISGGVFFPLQFEIAFVIEN